LRYGKKIIRRWRVKKLNLGLALILVLALAVAAGFACGGDDGGAEFELSGLTITPSEAGVDEDVSIQVTVENVGDEEGSTEVTLKVDGDEVDSQDVTVAAGATETVTFTHSESAEGTYAIKVDGESGTLTVTAGPPPPPGQPGVGSTWEYLVDYDDGTGYTEVDHPFTTTLTELDATPPAGLCVTTPNVKGNHYVVDTHPDGACPGVTVPKRVTPTAQIMSLEVNLWQNPTDGTAVFAATPLCALAPMAIPLDVEIAYTEYTAVSGTVGKPYAVGDKWTYTREEGASSGGACIDTAYFIKTFTVEVVAVDESVTVPAGTFTDCVKIVTTLDGTDKTNTVWWSPTVQSIVKQVDTIAAKGVETQELSSYNIK
jgi:hypothetical protein